VERPAMPPDPPVTAAEGALPTLAPGETTPGAVTVVPTAGAAQITPAPDDTAVVPTAGAAGAEPAPDAAGGESSQKSMLKWPRLILGMVVGAAVGVAVILIVAPNITHDLQNATLVATKPWFLVWAFLAVLVLLAADAGSLIILVRVMDPKARVSRVTGVALEAHLVGGATSFGGLEIPYQIMVLRRIGLTYPEATSCVMVKGLVHTSVLAVVALAALLPFAGSPITPLQRWIIIGVVGVLLLGWLVGWVWLRRPIGVHLMPRWLKKRIFSFLEALKILEKSGWEVYVSLVVTQLIYWVAMFAVIPLILHALGWRGSLASVVIGQAVLQVLMPLSPLPGGAGVAEWGYLELIGSETPSGIRVSSLILWRAATWVIPVAFGALALGWRTARGKKH
jgi:glycosyltransferase 2 family protein